MIFVRLVFANSADNTCCFTVLVYADQINDLIVKPTNKFTQFCNFAVKCHCSLIKQKIYKLKYLSKYQLILNIIFNYLSPQIAMPKQIKEFKQFLTYAKGPKAAKGQKPAKKTVWIKKNKKVTKFKIRRGRHLFTFVADKPELAKRLQDSLDSAHIEKVEIRKRAVAPKKAKK